MFFPILTPTPSITVAGALAIVLFGALGFLIVMSIINPKSSIPFPPGPPKRYLIGNLLDFPTSFEYLTFIKWGAQYGPITSINVLGTTLVVLNSYDQAIQMLDKKSSKYSSRPHIPMVMDLMDWDKGVGVTPYGPRLRGYRKFFREALANMQKWYPCEEAHARKFAKNLLNDPSDFLEHCSHVSGSLALHIAYGYTAKDKNDPIITQSNIAIAAFSDNATPGKFLVNVFPILRFVPEWLPGANFKKVAREGNGLYTEMVDGPFQTVKDELAAGAAQDSVTAMNLRKMLTPLEEDYLKHAAGTFFGAGGETTAGWIQFFFWAMLQWPDIQQKLQAEMDSVVPLDTLPSFADRQSLPYLEAFLKESLRFYPVAPIGLPHVSSEDDIHEGYFIPKGSIIFANLWQISRDETLYKSPETFKPDRFIGPNAEHNPYDIGFGFGRRICPGIPLADATMYITIATTVALFNIQPCIDELSGKPIIPELKTTGMVSNRLLPFECKIVPRQSDRISGLYEA